MTVERDTATEILFDTVVDTTLPVDVPMEFNDEDSPFDGDNDVNVAPADQHTLAGPDEQKG